MGRVGIIMTMGMRTRISGTVFLALWVALSAQAAKIALIKRDSGEVNALRFDVMNDDRHDISVCVSDDLNLGDPPVGQVTPFYLERFSNGHWHVAIGSDIALHVITFIKAGDRVPFQFHTRERGRYRLVMEYKERANFPSCEDFYRAHPRKLRSAPFNIP